MLADIDVLLLDIGMVTLMFCMVHSFPLPIVARHTERRTLRLATYHPVPPNCLCLS